MDTVYVVYVYNRKRESVEIIGVFKSEWSANKKLAEFITSDADQDEFAYVRCVTVEE